MRHDKLVHVLLLGCTLAGANRDAPAAWSTVGPLAEATATSDQARFATASGAIVLVSFITADVVHVRMSPGEPGREMSYAIAAPQHPLAITMRDADADGRIVLSTQAARSARVIIQTRPQLAITVFDGKGGLVLADDAARPMAMDPATAAIEVSKQRDTSELYYGFGEKAMPLSRHQQYLTMWNSDTPKYAPGLDPLYQDIPFFIALRQGASYGLFFDNTYRSYFDMGKTDPARYTFGASGGELDYYVFTGGDSRSPANVLRDYSALTGRTPLPPLWSLGYQQSRYSYTPDARVREIGHEFRARHIPADVIHLDIDYMDGYRVFTWSPKDFSEPQKLIGDLATVHFKVVTIVDPGVKVDLNYPIYRDGRERGVYVRNAAGDELHAAVWPGECAFPDFTDAAARAWFGSLYGAFLDLGVAGFWNDMNEPATFPPQRSDEPILAHDPGKTFALDARHAGDGAPGTHARYHNVYGMQMARSTFEGIAKLRPERRPLVLTRAGYSGVQRYAAVWTGDNVASWEHLALTIPMLTNLSISGVPFVGADIGGYAGSPSAELYARWLQAASLTPFFRTHAEIGSADREPWSYGPEFERINRATLELRYRLLPYLYTLFAEHEANGDAVLRPLWFEYPADVRTYLLDDQFLLGRDLLVAPVLVSGAVQRRVYFPQGDAWIDWWNGARHQGGTFADVAAPIDRLPLFVRAGAAVPVQPAIEHTDQMSGVPLTLLVALGADGHSHLFQDAGDGYGYRNGESRNVQIALYRNALSLRAESARSASRRVQRIGFVEFLGLDAAPKRVSIDGRIVRDFSFDAATRRLRVGTSGDNVREILLER